MSVANSALEEHFRQFGYVILTVENPHFIFSMKKKLQDKLREITHSKTINLEDYHNLNLSHEEHYHCQFLMTQYFRSTGFNEELLKNKHDFFRYLLGPDLDLQTQPYLRMVRPHEAGDNIGYHRDTYYGTAASELSVFVPFVDLPENNCLSIYPKSHVIPDQYFETESKENAEVQKGSERNQIGFLYAPHIIKTDIQTHMKPIPLKIGQILVFMLSTIHGAILNESQITRWSTDIRVKNHFYSLNKTMKEGYYLPFSKSVVFQCEQEYSKL